MTSFREEYINIFLAILAISIPVIIYFLQKKRKEFSYKVESMSKIIKKCNNLSSPIEILLEGKKIEDPHYILIKVWNSGNVPINPEDFKENVYIDFGKHSKIIQASIKETYPKNLGANIEVCESMIIISPVLFNEEDSLTIEAVV